MKAQDLIKFIREESLVPCTIYKNKDEFTIQLGSVKTDPMTKSEIIQYVQILNISHPTRDLIELIKNSNGIATSIPCKIPMSKRGVLAAEVQ